MLILGLKLANTSGKERTSFVRYLNMNYETTPF